MTWAAAIAESAWSALEGLRAHALRSALTVLGIVIGVGGVLVIDAVGQAQQAALDAQLAQMGTNLVAISPIAPPVRGVAGVSGTRATLALQDAPAIRQQVPHVAAISPSSGAREPVANGRMTATSQIVAAWPDYFRIQSYHPVRGAFFTAQDDASGATVAVVGQTVAERLYPNTDPVGQRLRIRNVDFRVVGTLSPKGHNGEHDLDDTVVIPFTTGAQRLYGTSLVQSILVQADRAANIDGVMSGAGRALRQTHHLPLGRPDDFRAQSLQRFVDAARQQASILTAIMRGVAAVALAIGGFGVMNIMLMAVTERTPEIGLRMAVGARRRDVLLQFLVEAMTVTLAGGAAGVVCGFAVAAVVPRVAASLAAYPAWPSLPAVGAALGVAVLTGTIFGLYPALRAARLDPIAALRAE